MFCKSIELPLLCITHSQTFHGLRWIYNSLGPNGLHFTYQICIKSCREMSSMQAYLFCLCTSWLLLVLLQVSPASGVPLNLPVRGERGDDISNSVTLPKRDVASPPSPTSSSNCSSSAERNETSRSRNFSSSAERMDAMLDSIRQQILLKLNLQEPPENPKLPAATSIPPSMLSTYYAHLQSVDADDSHECSRSEGSEATHFSRNLQLYYPHNFVSVKLPPDHFQIGKAILLL